MDIGLKDGAVCFADGEQWLFQESDTFVNNKGGFMCAADLIVFKDFQLNTIKQGGYIEASELDTEHKYNDAVEVFGLCGFECKTSFESFEYRGYLIADELNRLYSCRTYQIKVGARKLTYPQLMAIGELKRLEIERSAPKITPDLTPDLGIVSSNKYERDITDRKGNSAVVDVYDVLKAFDVTCPATQHALKKLLCSGLRGHKDLQTDLLEAKESITRAIELNG